MAVTFHTVTGNIADIGLNVDPTRVEVLLTTNLPAGEVLFDTANNRVLVGSQVLEVAEDGSFTFTVPATDSADVNPPGVQYRLRIKFPDPAQPSGRDEAVLGWFDLLGAGPSTLTALVTSSYVPVNFMSDAIATLQALIDQAELATGVNSSDSAVAYLIEFGALTNPALDTVIATAIAALTLGTASTKNFGTASGQVALLNASGRYDVARLGSGTPNGSQYLRDDGTFASVAGGLPIAVTTYSPATATTFTTTATTPTDIDATNLAVTFTVPSSGAVRVRLEGLVELNVAGQFSLRQATTNVPTTNRQVGLLAASQTYRTSTLIHVTGLTPGASVTYKWAWRGSNLRLYCGNNTDEFASTGDYGPAIMEVYAA